MLVVMVDNHAASRATYQGRIHEGGCQRRLTCLGGVAAAPLGSVGTAGAAPAAVEEVSEVWAAVVPLVLLSALGLTDAWVGPVLAGTV